MSFIDFFKNCHKNKIDPRSLKIICRYCGKDKDHYIDFREFSDRLKQEIKQNKDSFFYKNSTEGIFSFVYKCKSIGCHSLAMRDSFKNEDYNFLIEFMKDNDYVKKRKDFL